MNSTSRLLMVVVFVVLAGRVQGQAPGPAFECRWAGGPIVIDGKGDEPAWKHAQLIDRFSLPWQKGNPSARTATRARLLWDREYLYYFADMDDADLYADVKESGGAIWTNDVFELFFKPAEDRPGYYEFQVNPAAAQLTMFLPRRGAGGFQRFAKDSPFHMDAKVQLRGTLNHWRDKDQGWSVEGRIPWSDFLPTGGRPQRDEQWKFALCRYDYSVEFEGPELSTMALLKAPYGGPNFHYFEGYAPLKFVGPEKSERKGGLRERKPLTTSKVVGSPDPPPPFRAERVFPRLTMSHPLCAEAIPGTNDLLVVFLDQGAPFGRIARLRDDSGADRIDDVVKTPDHVYALAFHPRWRDNGYIYLGGNGPQVRRTDKSATEKQTRIVRYTMQTRPPFTIDPASAKEILAWKSDGHNGGALAFGKDGMLYITSGDGTSDSDTWESGQDMSRLLAKVLRVDVDRTDPGKAYAVPPDNPFVKVKGARPETWALGLRNPWRMSADPISGQIWVGNNGQDLFEQAYLVKKGDNYGWSVTEGSAPFYSKRPVGPAPIVPPTIEHPHSEARSLTGGFVYRGAKYPELVGAYLYGDYSTGNLWAVLHDGKKIVWHKLLAQTRLTLTGINADSRGEILLTDYQGAEKGALYTLTRTPAETKASTFPRTLSESGLFRSIAGHAMQPGLIPYSVNSVLWSDGVEKSRWLALPDGQTIEYARNGSWKFPDETVLVKSFFLELEPGNAASKRWIETRFFTRQRGEWFGYSYAWNDEQTEGFLVEAAGRDRTFTLTVPRSPEHPKGQKEFPWRFPSRTECMVCHSRAANWTLGLTEAQFNKVHDYGDHGNGAVRENQLDVFERLQLFQVPVHLWGDEIRSRQRDRLKHLGMDPKAIDEALAKIGQARDQRTPKGTTLLPASADRLKKLVDPRDPKADLTLRVRSYLHSNCSQCHVAAGGGNSAMQLDFATPLEKMKLIDVPPLHQTFGIAEPRLVAPGDPDRSVLLKRIAHRGQGHMPPLATRLVDQQAVDLLREWIRSLPTKSSPSVKSDGSR